MGEPWVSTRYVILGCAFVGYNLIYIFRVNLGMAIVAMVDARDLALPSDYECTAPLGNNTSGEDSRKPGEFFWDEKTQGLVLSGFFFTYGFGSLIGGRLAEKLGAKWVLGCGTGLTAVLSLLTPLAARHNVGTLVAVRALSGLFGVRPSPVQRPAPGIAFPSMNTIVSRWMTKSERSRAFSLLISGSRMGNVVGLLLTGYICESDYLGGWPSAFYLFGGIGLVWFLVWITVMHETPRDHPRISQKELDHILAKQGQEVVRKNPPIPYRQILTSLPVLAVVVASVGESWGSATIPTSLPTYMANIMHLSISQSGYATALPCFLQTLDMWLSGHIADAVLRKKWLSRTAVRKILTFTGTILPCVCLCGTTLAGCNWLTNLVLFTLAMACNGFVAGGFRASVLDIAPDFAGTIMGLSVGVGNVFGFLSPYTVGILTNDAQTLVQWHKVYWICAGLYAMGGVAYLLGGSSELQPWGLYRDPSDPTMPCKVGSLKELQANMQANAKLQGLANNGHGDLNGEKQAVFVITPGTVSHHTRL